MKAPSLLGILTSLMAAGVAQSALLYSISTDTGGSFTSGGWTDSVGTATVLGPAGQQAISPAVPNGSGGSAQLLQGFTAGTLDLGTVTGFGPIIPAGTTATMDIALNAGTADLGINTIALVGGTLARPNGFGVSNMSGVNSLTVEFNWSVSLAAAFGSLPKFNDPFLGAIRAIGSGSWDVEAEYLGLLHTTDGLSLKPGLPAGANGIDAQFSQSSWGTDGASSNWTISTTGGAAWHAIHGFETVGGPPFTTGNNGDSVLQDAETVYATGIRYTIAPNGGGTFDGDAAFLFSTHGNQWTDTVNLPVVAIPEPTRLALLVIGFGMVQFRRRR